MPLNHCLVFADISSERATLNALLGTCGFIGALSFLVFLGISILLSRWAVRPVETAWMQQRQFVADASHELKTPLTVIITNTELAQSNECSESVRRTSLNNIAAVSRQMRNLIEQMLELARADNARGKELSGKVELGKLILNALLTFEPVFFERGRMLEQRVIEDIHVQGSAEQLRQIVDILLDNAQKYSRESGKTRFSTDLPEFAEAEKAVQDKIDHLMNIKGKKSVDSIHKELGRVMWEYVGMGRTAEGLKTGLAKLKDIRKEFETELFIPGSKEGLNVELDKAFRLNDFITMGELIAYDALNRNESCGGHFREEYQTEEGEAKRDDENFFYVACWEYQGSDDKAPVLYKEPLVYEAIKVQTRNYKS